MHSPSRPSFARDLRTFRDVRRDPEKVRLAISTLAISVMLFATMVWLIVTYL